MVDTLQIFKVEDEHLVLEYYDKQILTQLDTHYMVVERYFGSVPLLVVVPYDDFVQFLLVDQCNDVAFVHHFD